MHLYAVLGQMHQYRLKFKPKKGNLYKLEITFLGHVISRQGIFLNSKKVRAIQEWSNSIQELRALPLRVQGGQKEVIAYTKNYI